MRVLLVFSALVVCAFSIEIDFKPILEVQEDFNLGQQFQDFVVKFGKKYANDTLELASRYSIYKSNRMLVNELNSNDDDFATYSLDTPFADMTPEEFKRRILMKGSSIPKFPLSRYMKAPKLKDIPSSFDWRENNAVSPVKDQGSLGSCWAFSTVGNIEGQLAIQNSRLVELSVEQLIECDSFHDRKHSDCGVFGGWPYLAFEYIIQAGGIKSERDYPYCSGIPYGDPGFCVPCMPKNYVADLCGNHSDLYCKPSGTLGQTPNGFCTKVTDPEASLSTWKAVSSDEDEIAATLATTGPLSVLMNANFLQFYKSGIYNPFSCDKSSLDHAVLLVGYGTSRGKDYWIVKNSWGEKWGEKGYFRILRGKGTCGINTAVTTSILSSQESKTSKAIL